MVRFHAIKFALLLMVAGATAGCQSIGDTGALTSDSLLKAASASPDAVAVDIYWARTSLDDEQFADALWQSVQEDRLPVELRRALAADGLRAGVVGGTPSEEIVRLLNPDGKTASEAAESAGRLSATPPKVTRRLRQLSPGSRLEIQATDTPRTMPLLRAASGGLTGQEYPDAQGIYAVQLTGQQAERVSLQLAPELHFGQPHMKYTPSGPGMVVQQLTRDTQLFDELEIEVDLAAGEILVITALPGAEHRLGGLFHHTGGAGSPEQKYLLVRLSQVPTSPALAASPESVWPWQ